MSAPKQTKLVKLGSLEIVKCRVLASQTERGDALIGINEPIHLKKSPTIFLKYLVTSKQSGRFLKNLCLRISELYFRHKAS